MANINEQIKNQVSGSLSYKISKQNCGPSVSSKTESQWKKERERQKKDSSGTYRLKEALRVISTNCNERTSFGS